MNHSADNSQYVRRVVLPSGRAIEVVYFERRPLPPTPDRAVRARIVTCTICPECDRDLVYPVEWEEASPTHWEVLLRCPNCEWTRVGVFDQADVDRFDEELDRGTEALVGTSSASSQANMEDEIERFTAALDVRRHLAEDF